MAKTKFTPGPWGIKENLGTDERYCDWHSIGPVELPGGSADANSHLMAATPDLYEATEPFVFSSSHIDLEGADINGDVTILIPVTIRTLRSVKAACAKARGEAI